MEHQVSEILINAWAFIFTLMLTAYVALDGFDLGIGILSLFERDSSRKAIMMEGLGGVWDANETWLVLLGGTLFGAFPLAYASVLEALYVPVLLMLFALIFRGVAFEFRLYASRKQAWFLAFGIGSLVAAMAQGLMFGTLVGGMVNTEPGIAVNLFVWLSPYSTLAAILVINLYILLGACYLIRKTEGDLFDSTLRWAMKSAVSMCFLLPIFAWCSALVMPSVGYRWHQEIFLYGLLAFCVAFSLAMTLRSLRHRQRGAPFGWALSGLIFALISLVFSHYPYLVPGSMTLHSAASATKTLHIMLYFIGGLLPIIVGYNIYQYYVFRGPIKLGH